MFLSSSAPCTERSTPSNDLLAFRTERKRFGRISLSSNDKNTQNEEQFMMWRIEMKYRKGHLKQGWYYFSEFKSF